MGASQIKEAAIIRQTKEAAVIYVNWYVVVESYSY